MMNLINQSSVPMPRQFIEQWLNLTVKELAQKRLIQNRIQNRNQNRDQNGIQKGSAKKSLHVEITVVFLNIAAAKKLNHNFRGKDYATDILSFQGEWPQNANWGELVICPQVLKKQAKAHGHSFKAELGYMLIHGVLHLLGYDHERSKRAATRMFEIQDQLFDRLCAKFQI